jgi:hypothetical protein
MNTERKMTYIKQFGLPRSGTNALKALIEINFKNVIVLSNYLGNKHEPTSWSKLEEKSLVENAEDFGLELVNKQQVIEDVRNKTIPVIINIKDPMSWVNSYYKYQLKKALFKNPDTNLQFDTRFAERALSSWKENVLSWITFHDGHPKSVIFLHEEVVAGLDHQLETLRSMFNLEASVHYPTGLLKGYARRGTDCQHGVDLVNPKMDFKREYHLEGGWIKDIPEDLISFLDKYKTEFLHKNQRFRRIFS